MDKKFVNPRQQGLGQGYIFFCCPLQMQNLARTTWCGYSDPTTSVMRKRYLLRAWNQRDCQSSDLFIVMISSAWGTVYSPNSHDIVHLMQSPARCECAVSNLSTLKANVVHSGKRPCSNSVHSSRCPLPMYEVWPAVCGAVCCTSLPGVTQPGTDYHKDEHCYGVLCQQATCTFDH